MRRGGAGKRRDTAEPAIIEALQAIGVEVWQLHGDGLPDLLARHRGRYYVGEVKTGKGRLSPQQAIRAWPVWRMPEDAMRTLGLTP